MTEIGYMTVKDLIVYSRLSERKIRGLISKNCPDPIPSFRVGSKILFRQDEVDAWMTRRRTPRPQTTDVIKSAHSGVNIQDLLKKIQRTGIA